MLYGCRETDLNEVLQTTVVFSSVRNGVVAPAVDIVSCFGEHMSEDAVVQTILRRGKLQVSKLERKTVRDDFVREVLGRAASMCVHGETGMPIPVEVLKATCDDMRVKIKPPGSYLRRMEGMEGGEASDDKPSLAAAAAAAAAGDGAAGSSHGESGSASGAASGSGSGEFGGCSSSAKATGASTAGAGASSATGSAGSETDPAVKEVALQLVRALIEHGVPIRRASIRLRVAIPSGAKEKAVEAMRTALTVTLGLELKDEQWFPSYSCEMTLDPGQYAGVVRVVAERTAGQGEIHQLMDVVDGDAEF